MPKFLDAPQWYNSSGSLLYGVGCTTNTVGSGSMPVSSGNGTYKLRTVMINGDTSGSKSIVAPEGMASKNAIPVGQSAYKVDWLNPGSNPAVLAYSASGEETEWLEATSGGNVLCNIGNGNLAWTTGGSAGQVLTYQGASSKPTWQSVPWTTMGYVRYGAIGQTIPFQRNNQALSTNDSLFFYLVLVAVGVTFTVKDGTTSTMYQDIITTSANCQMLHFFMYFDKTSTSSTNSLWYNYIMRTSTGSISGGSSKMTAVSGDISHLLVTTSQGTTDNHAHFYMATSFVK